MTFHSKQRPGAVHVVQHYEYADEAARLAASGFISDDIGRVAHQLDNDSFWILISTTPTWVQFSATANMFTGLQDTPSSYVGEAGKVATVNGAEDGLEFSAGVVDISCKITKSASQSIPNATLTAITWDQESYDTDGMHDTVTNNTRVTFNTAGKYSVLAQAEWETAGGIFRFLEIMKNGSGGIARVRYGAEGASENIVPYVGAFQVGDYIELCVYQDAGGNIDFKSGTGIENTYLEAHKIN